METKLFAADSFKNPSGITLFILLAILLLALGFIGLKPLPMVLVAFSAAVSGGLGYYVLPILQKLKAGQVIQEDGPATHLKKAGTPTMGGIFLIPTAVIIALSCGGFTSNLIAVSLVTLAYGAIGWWDDWQILRQKSNKGMTPRQKLILQVTVAILFCLWMWSTQPETITSVKLPAGLTLSLGLFFWLLAGFAIVAESNATNLTDGVDGLAGGTGAIAFLGLAILVAPTHPDLMIFAVCLSGGCLGFVLHNRNPARVFMGDTGSLALGGALAAVGILTQNLWALFIISGIFFIESISVIAQVSYYKATKGPDGKGKRLLKMAPIHHHLELTGWSETQIVGAFYLINTILVILSLVVDG